MAKGAGRKTERVGVPPARTSAPLSVEEADRAAAAFVPLWQLDEAPFAAGGHFPEADLHALAAPREQAVAMQLATARTLGAAPPIAADVVVLVGPADPVAPAPSDQDLLMSRSTVKMVPFHQPNAPRADEPDLPSVIVDPPPQEPLSAPATVPMRAAAAPSSATPAPAVPPPALREPKTDPPAARARPPRPVAANPTDPDDVATAGYRLPRRRTPMLIGAGLVGSALLIFGAYAVSSAMSVTPVPAAAATAADTTPNRSASSRATSDPGPVIPPVADEAPPRAVLPTAVAPPRVAATPPAPAPATPVTPIPVATPAMLPPAPTPRAAVAPPPIAPRAAVARTPPATRPATPRNPTPSSAAGGIVRDNPF